MPLALQAKPRNQGDHANSNLPQVQGEQAGQNQQRAKDEQRHGNQVQHQVSRVAVVMVVATPLPGGQVGQTLAHGHFLTVMPKA